MDNLYKVNQRTDFGLTS